MLQKDSKNLAVIYENVNKNTTYQQKVQYILENNTLNSTNKNELSLYIESLHQNDATNFSLVIDELHSLAKNNCLNENWWENVKSGFKGLASDVGRGVSSVANAVTPHSVSRGIGNVQGRLHATQPHAETGMLLKTMKNMTSTLQNLNTEFTKYKLLPGLRTSFTNGTMDSYITSDASGNNQYPIQLTDFQAAVDAVKLTLAGLSNSISGYVHKPAAPAPASTTPAPAPAPASTTPAPAPASTTPAPAPAPASTTPAPAPARPRDARGRFTR